MTKQPFSTPLAVAIIRNRYVVVDGRNVALATISTDQMNQAGIAAYFAKAPKRDAVCAELLDALKQGADCLQDVATMRGGWAWEEVIETMRAAIAKAKKD